MAFRIALYHDEASGERYEEKAFQKTKIRYDKIGPADMTSEGLDRYDVVFLPGAFPLKRHSKGGFRDFLRFMRRLGTTYRDPLIEYVKSGGGLVAICASVAAMGRSVDIPLPIKPYYWSRPPLGIFDFHARYGPKTGVVDLEPVDYARPPEAVRLVKKVLGDYADGQFPTLYFRGPVLTYDRRSEIVHPSFHYNEKRPEEVMVARYVDRNPKMFGKGAIVYKRFGEGRAISCSVHPEFSTWDLFDSMIDAVARR